MHVDPFITPAFTEMYRIASLKDISEMLARSIKSHASALAAA